MASSQLCIQIGGYSGCYFFMRAQGTANLLKQKFPNSDIKISVEEKTPDDYRRTVEEHLKKLFPTDQNALRHKQSPYVYVGCTENEYRFIGGSSDFEEYAKKFSESKANTIDL